MTPPTPAEGAVLAVTQEDRKAASDAFYALPKSHWPAAMWMADMENGEHDDAPMVQAFARHRLATRPAWRSIESAPKDGTEVDLWGSRPGSDPARIPDCAWLTLASGPDWYTRGEDGWECLGACRWTPTYWMPTPTPPEPQP